jgi:hypothetical protein
MDVDGRIPSRELEKQTFSKDHKHPILCPVTGVCVCA